MRVALCTCPPDAAEMLARTLITAGAACVNILPAVKSLYMWEGALQADTEALLMVKAAADRMPALFLAMQQSHPYQLPEWVVLEPDALLTSAAYRRWVLGEPPAR